MVVFIPRILGILMISIDIYPRHEDFEHLLDLYPLQPANKFLPDWYKEVKITQRIDDQGFDPKPAHAKRCPAIQNEILEGYILPSWTDVFVEIKNGEVYMSASVGNISGLGPTEWSWIQHHTPGQIKQMNLNTPTKFGIFKLVAPYYFVTTPGYGLSFRPLPYHLNQHLRILPGTVETDIWHETNFPFEFVQDLTVTKGTKFFIEAGEPLAVLTPYKKNEKSILTNHKYDSNMLQSQYRNTKELFTYSSNWKKYSKIHNKITEEE